MNLKKDGIKRRWSFFLLLSVCLLFGIEKSHAQATNHAVTVFPSESVQDSTDTRDGGFYAVANVASITAAYKPVGSLLIDYKTESLSFYATQAILGYGSIPLMRFDYQGVFNSSVRQKEMLATNKHQKTGLEKYTAGLSVGPIVDYLFTSGESGWILKTLFSTEITYNQAIFYGNAEISKPGLYIPIPSGAGRKTLSAGESVSFKSELKDTEITVGSWFRFGYYNSSWNKPINDIHVTDATTGLPVLFDGNFRFDGVSFKLLTLDRSADGLCVDLGYKYGAGSLTDKNGSVIIDNLKSKTILADVWYNWYPFAVATEPLKGLAVTLGASLDWRWVKQDPGYSIVVSEYLSSLYLRLGYRF